MRPRSWLVLLLVLSFAGLRALAAASPPDPLWLPGVYDDADYDDVVLAVFSLDGSRDDAPATLQPPARLIAGLDAICPVAPRPRPPSFH